MASKFYPTSKLLLLLLFVSGLCVSAIAQNPIVTENALPGNPYTEWGVPNFRDNSINGFSQKMSLNAGETVDFRINVQPAAGFNLKIYRIGYYNGNGARLIQDLGQFNGVTQPLGISDPATGLIDCSNWSVSASWNIPVNAVSGLYIAKLERTGGGSNHIAFIVRNDASNADLYLQIPDATWQAYNGYGGNSLYDGNTSFPSGHAVKVSYNRPFFPYNTLFNSEGKEADWYMNAVYPMIRWIERNGYSVTYAASNDIATKPALLLNHKVFISAGHDEYWSKEQRENVEAALDAGVHLAFFSGNEVYWKTRWEDLSDGEHRTLVCYKEGLLGDGSIGERTCAGKCDASSSEWTGLWRTGADYDAGRPENALTGQISWTETDGAIQVPSKYKKLRFWRNTSVASLADGQTATLAPNSLGYEWDYEQYSEHYPEARITMSSTTINNFTHKLSLYRHNSGALVFGAGTVQWSWGLDDGHLGGSPVVSAPMQQATVNLFADMGVQPATLQAGLMQATASTDVSGPVSVISFPANGSTTPASAAITISGTATDAGGGIVGGVEVSTDGGLTWKQAELNTLDATVSWTFNWVPTVEGPVTIKTRAFDDSGNKEIPGNGISITIGPAVCPCTIFTSADVPAKPLNNDGIGGIELGVKFRVAQDGFITAIRYYKGDGTTGTHTGSLWSSTGSLLGRAVFTNETTSGWQQVSFSAPVPVSAGVTYVASYHSSSGDYAATNPFFTDAAINGPLRALANGEDGPNGVYVYTANPAFPANASQTNNYWVDIVYTREDQNTAPLVTTQPVPVTVCEGDSARFNSAADGQPSPAPQWQRSTDGVNWTDISGATDAAYSFKTTATDNNTHYRAVWTNSAGSVNSNSSTLTVNVKPVLSSPLTASVNSGESFNYTPASATTGTTFSWSRAVIAGINNPAASGSGMISEKLVSTSTDPLVVQYLITLSANGCINTETVNVTVNPVSVADCSITSSIRNNFNGHKISKGTYIWFNSSIKTQVPGHKRDEKTEEIYVTNSWISFRADGKNYKLKVPDSRIRYVVNAQEANVRFANNRWEITIPRHVKEEAFMGGLVYKVPDNLPKKIKNVEWTADISLDKGVSVSWRWQAAVYTQLGAHDQLEVKPLDTWRFSLFPNSNEEGTPENFTRYLIKGATGDGKKDYTGDPGKKEKVHCKKKGSEEDNEHDDDHDDDHGPGKNDPVTKLIKKLLNQLPLSALNQGHQKLEVSVSPNPSNTHFNLSVRSKMTGTSTIIVSDLFGKVLERHDRVNVNGNLRLGNNLQTGVYFVSVIQGNQRTTVMVVKVR